MKRFIWLLYLLITISSCDKFPDPSIQQLKNYYFVYENEEGQIISENEPVTVKLRSYITNNSSSENSSSEEYPFEVIFKVVSGSGTLSAEMVNLGMNGIATTEWQPGSASFKQTIRAYIYDNTGKFLASADLSVFKFRTNEWDAVSMSPVTGIEGLVADTVNNITLMVTNNKLYRQGSKYYLWDEIVDPVIVSPRTIGIDSNNIIYISTWNGEVVKSTDHGHSWIKCTKPFPDDPYFVFLHISNDNYLWAFKFDYPCKYSNDGGFTWTSAGSIFSEHGHPEVYRLKDGSLLFHGSDCCSLYQTSDFGNTAKKIETPGYSLKLFVNDNDIFIGTQEQSGWSIYKSSNLGETFALVHRVMPDFGGSMGKLFHKWDNFYYVLVQGYGILKSYDLVHYDTYWVNKSIYSFYIDHNGVLLAKDYSTNVVHYRKNIE